MILVLFLSTNPLRRGSTPNRKTPRIMPTYTLPSVHLIGQKITALEVYTFILAQLSFIMFGVL